MFCPNCGAKNSSEQKFCRLCGMNIEQTAIELAEQFGDDREDSEKTVDRFFRGLGKFAFGGLGIVILIGIGFLLYTIFMQLILEGSRIEFGIFLMVFIVFAALSLAYVFYNEIKKDRKQSRPSEASQKEFSAPDTRSLLNEPSQIPIPSIVEDTTDLLTVESKTRKL